MKKLFFLISILSLNVFAQDSKRSFNLKDFDKLQLGYAFNINVTRGNSYKIEAKGYEKDIEDLVAKVSNGKLYVGYPEKFWSSKRRKIVYLTIEMPELNQADFSGASTSKVKGFESRELNLSVSGASSAVFEVDAKDLKIDCSGASNIKLIGNGSKIDADISGASDLITTDFKVEMADVDASGASDAKVFVTQKLNADASGASSIRYKGSPSVKSNTSGAGSVKSM